MRAGLASSKTQPGLFWGCGNLNRPSDVAERDEEKRPLLHNSVLRGSSSRAGAEPKTPAIGAAVVVHLDFCESGPLLPGFSPEQDAFRGLRRPNDPPPVRPHSRPEKPLVDLADSLSPSEADLRAVPLGTIHYPVSRYERVPLKLQLRH